MLYSINTDIERTPKYELSDNVKSIIQVPLWSPEEPFDCVDYNLKYSKVLEKRGETTDEIISSIFIPNFERLIRQIYSEEHCIDELDKCFYNLWRFFQKYDYKLTMSSSPVWESFCNSVKSLLPQEELIDTTMEDLTIALRWLYRFLIPITIDVPKVDISHVTISGITILPALAAKYKHKTPILITEHGVFIRERLLAISSSNYSYFLKRILIKFSECITRLAYFHAAKISTVSKFNMSWEKFYGADADKIKVIYNGVNHNVFKPREKPTHLEGIPTVVAAARIFDLKDIITMIKTCNVVKETIPNVQFLIYGNKDAVPEYTKECEALIEELSLQSNFKLLGFHKQPELIYSEGDISILTSISEGFPYTVIESMSSGVPIVSTDVGGVSEALDENCGYICKPKNHEEIGKRVIELLQNEELRKRMGENAREKVIANFTIENFIMDFENMYNSLKISQLKPKKRLALVG